MSLVPTSAITGEGIPDLLMLITQLTQTLMEGKLQYLSGLQVGSRVCVRVCACVLLADRPRSGELLISLCVSVRELIFIHPRFFCFILVHCILYTPYISH